MYRQEQVSKKQRINSFLRKCQSSRRTSNKVPVFAAGFVEVPTRSEITAEIINSYTYTTGPFMYAMKKKEKYINTRKSQFGDAPFFPRNISLMLCQLSSKLRRERVPPSRGGIPVRDHP